MTSTEIVSATGLSFSRGRTQILDDLTLGMRTGELTVIIGPNGGGKTTLLRLLTGDLKPDQGNVRFDGQDMSGWPLAELAARRAVMSQAIELSFPFIVEDVLGLGLSEIRHSRRREITDRTLAELGLDTFRGRRMTDLSGGEQQRIHLARVLCQLAGGDTHRPQYLFLDEPTSSLDIRHQFEVLAAVRKRLTPQFGATIVLHDLNLAAAFADRVIILNSGRIAADGAPRQSMTEDLLSKVYGIPLSAHLIAARLVVAPMVNERQGPSNLLPPTLCHGDGVADQDFDDSAPACRRP